MKSLSYISKATTRNGRVNLPIGLSDIFRTSRVKNKEHGITGVLSFSRGYYFQVIEGETKAVDQLMQKIMRDDRHSNVEIVFEYRISRRIFPGRGLHLLYGSPQNDENFIAYIDSNLDRIKKLPTARRTMLQPFIIDHALGSNQFGDFKDRELYLEDWPNFAQIEPSREIIDLCTELLSQTVSYQDLKKNFGARFQTSLDDILGRLRESGALRVNGETERSDFRGRKPRRQNGIYSSLSTLLKRGKVS